MKNQIEILELKNILLKLKREKIKWVGRLKSRRQGDRRKNQYIWRKKN